MERKVMGLAVSLQKFIESRGVHYEVVAHERTLRSDTTAEASGVSEENLAKGVLIRWRDGYMLAIVPASRHVELAEIGNWLKKPVALATEAEVAKIFADCELGAVPPVAGAYGLSAVMDECLEGFKDIYFEGGDHRTLVHLSGHNFHLLTMDVPHAHISVRNH
jgi:Ala-tRNA(Pro) deacylase